MNSKKGKMPMVSGQSPAPAKPEDAKAIHVFLIGSGAREHAIAWKLAQSDIVEKLLVFPGNAGTMQLKQRKVRHLRLNLFEDDFEHLSEVAREKRIDLVIVDPMRARHRWINPLEHFQKVGTPCFCPSPQMTKFEGYKSYAKDFMLKHDVPTAPYAVFEDLDQAISHVRKIAHRVVIKSDQIVKSQRVFLPETKFEAYGDLTQLHVKGAFGPQRGRIVIEKHLQGREISVMCFSDGKFVNPVGLFCNRKHLYDGDKGELSAGMGVYSPPPFINKDIINEIDRRIIRPTFAGFREDGIDYKGCPMIDIMLTEASPMVLGYDTSMGDPETQNAILMLSGQTDLAALMMACVHGTLEKVHLSLRQGYTCSVAVETRLHVDSKSEFRHISFGGMPEHTFAFYHSVAKYWGGGELEVYGQRLCTVTARGDTLEMAVWRAYKGVEAVEYPNKRFREDIAASDVDRSKLLNKHYAC